MAILEVISGDFDRKRSGWYWYGDFFLIRGDETVVYHEQDVVKFEASKSFRMPLAFGGAGGAAAGATIAGPVGAIVGGAAQLAVNALISKQMNSSVNSPPQCEFRVQFKDGRKLKAKVSAGLVDQMQKRLG